MDYCRLQTAYSAYSRTAHMNGNALRRIAVPLLLKPLIHGVRSDTERAREMSTTPPSAARSARCIHAVESRRASTAAPEELHRSGTIPRSGTPQWSHTGGETTQSLQNPRDVRPARRFYFRLPAMASLPLEARWKLLICQHTSGIVRGADSRHRRLML